MTDRDWRTWAYLQRDNWPEAVPGMGPQRKHGPWPWPEKQHHDPHDLDDYPHTHIDACSIGDDFIGDVCPYCGVPLQRSETVVLHDGTKGTFYEINEVDNPVPAYHPECWKERHAEEMQLSNYTLGRFA